jgi:periplasmic divalent cation tolerance protein
VEPSAPVEVTVTAASAEEAERLASMAVERRLAACAQVSGPVTSTYWWEGTLSTATEWVCVYKTVVRRVAALTSAVRSAHSYDVPEVVVSPITGGDEDYLAWLDAETSEDVVSPGP